MGISYVLGHYRPDAISAHVTAGTDERWESNFSMTARSRSNVSGAPRRELLRPRWTRCSRSFELRADCAAGVSNRTLGQLSAPVSDTEVSDTGQTALLIPCRRVNGRLTADPLRYSARLRV